MARFLRDQIDLAHAVSICHLVNCPVGTFPDEEYGPLDGKLYDNKIDWSSVTHHHYLKMSKQLFDFLVTTQLEHTIY